MTERRPSADESKLWRTATMTCAAPPPPPPSPPPAPPVPPAPAAPVIAPQAAPGLDHRSAQRLKRGQMTLDARLDLHGMTQEPAHRSLIRFVARAYDEGRRALLIITGKGSGEGTGVLRQAVPRWLAEPACRAMILAVEEAQPKDGGGGALYVRLRLAAQRGSGPAARAEPTISCGLASQSLETGFAFRDQGIDRLDGLVVNH